MIARVSPATLAVGADDALFPGVVTVGYETHCHTLEHQGNAGRPEDADPISREALRQIHTWYTGLFAEAVRKMKAIDEGGGTLLDNCLLVYTSYMSNGGHGTEDYPYLLVGGARGTLKTGRQVTFPARTPAANLYVDAFKVPSRMMHLHHMFIRLKDKAPTKDELLECYRNEFGVAIVNSAKGTGDVRKRAIELGFAHGDTNMVHIHQDILRTQEDTVKIGYSDDQTGMVIPENHLLLQSMLFKRSREEALKRTDNLFQISKKRKVLEEEFK